MPYILTLDEARKFFSMVFCWLLYISGDFSWAQGSFADEDRDQGAPTRGVQLNEIQSPSSS